ncbi:hypothetical protein Mucpa_0097 [Mucilaginibacter paludis DSM 18603]|uniref:Uncharacterized protein n=1 Tax=Mucilaginibacter paludis DSM 18603 TaxID=714943 RepID=H1YDW0_9SPHI|nr:hypothetical protein Mucpa_0097 [Mucilaginibacter paludis DSM 18603]
MSQGGGPEMTGTAQGRPGSFDVATSQFGRFDAATRVQQFHPLNTKQIW